MWYSWIVFRQLSCTSTTFLPSLSHILIWHYLLSVECCYSLHDSKPSFFYVSIFMGIKAILTMPSHHSLSTNSNLVCPSRILPILHEFLKTTLFFKCSQYISLNHASLITFCRPTYIFYLLYLFPIVQFLVLNSD